MKQPVALLDWDGTLRPGWTVEAWLAYLVRAGHASERALQGLRSLVNAYEQRRIDHDRLANESASLYALTIEGCSEIEVADLARSFVMDDLHNVHSFVRHLIAFLKYRNIEPIVISGAPSEILRLHAPFLGVSESYALLVDVEGGFYRPRVLINPGTSVEKARITEQFKRAGKEIVLALGDSSSDLPLFRAARLQVVVNNRALSESLGGNAMPFTPQSGEDLSIRLDTLLGDG